MKWLHPEITAFTNLKLATSGLWFLHRPFDKIPKWQIEKRSSQPRKWSDRKRMFKLVKSYNKEHWLSEHSWENDQRCSNLSGITMILFDCMNAKETNYRGEQRNLNSNKIINGQWYPLPLGPASVRSLVKSFPNCCRSCILHLDLNFSETDWSN